MPEASVARELALCFTHVALVTDLDAGVEGDAGVTHAEVMEVFAANIERLKAVLRATVPRLPAAGGRRDGSLRLPSRPRRAHAALRPALTWPAT